MIDFARFSQPTEGVMPFVNGEGVFKGRKVKHGNENGWFKIMAADSVAVLDRANQIEREMALQRCPILKGFPLGDQFIPLNFNNLEVLGFEQSTPLFFNQSDVWDVIKAGLWEDGNFYFGGIDYAFERDVIEKVRGAFENEKSIRDIKGTTPELRYYFILLSLHRDSHRKLQELAKMKLAEKEREKLLKEFRKTFSGRLESAVKNAGGELVRFYRKSGNRILVVWKIQGIQVKTVIEDTMKVIDLGYCINSDPHDVHTMSSAIVLAKIFQEKGDLFITRE